MFYSEREMVINSELDQRISKLLSFNYTIKLNVTSNSENTRLAKIHLVACQTRARGADRSGMMYTRANAHTRSYHHAATFMSRRKRDRSLNRPSLLINSRVVHLRIKRFSRNTVSWRFISRSLPDFERVAIS